MFEPFMGPFVCINNMSRVIIQPKISAQTESTPAKRSFDDVKNHEDTWIGCFQVDYFYSGSQENRNKCSNITSVDIEEMTYCPSESKIGAGRKPFQYLASIQAVRSPMQIMKVKDSSTNSMKKFLQSIENSYTENFYDLGNLNTLVYAYLNINEECLDSVLRNGSTFNAKLKIKMSQFLRNQLKLFEINPKVIIKASSVLNNENEILLSNTTKKRIKLRTNYDKNVKKFHLINIVSFILDYYFNE